jgi:hypothetical protein
MTGELQATSRATEIFSRGASTTQVLWKDWQGAAEGYHHSLFKIPDRASALPPSRVHLARENRRSQLGGSVVNDGSHGFHGHNRHSTGHPFLFFSSAIESLLVGHLSVSFSFHVRVPIHDIVS